MAFIDYIPYDNANDDLKKLYEQLGGKSKQPANIVRIAGPNPPVLKAHIDFYRAIMFKPSPLSRQQRELIATVTSVINQCHY